MHKVFLLKDYIQSPLTEGDKAEFISQMGRCYNRSRFTIKRASILTFPSVLGLLTLSYVKSGSMGLIPFILLSIVISFMLFIAIGVTCDAKAFKKYGFSLKIDDKSMLASGKGAFENVELNHELISFSPDAKILIDSISQLDRKPYQFEYKLIAGLVLDNVSIKKGGKLLEL